MFAWVKKWFAKQGAEVGLDNLKLKHGALAAVQNLPLADSLPVEDSLPQAAISREDVGLVFFSWLVGVDHLRRDIKVRVELANVEQIILNNLEKMADSPSSGAELLPRVPAIVPKLLKSLRDEKISSQVLADQLSQDVVLIAEVIREANSPYYHPSKPITNVKNAVQLLGHCGLRLLIARVAFRPIMSDQMGEFTNRVAPLIWAQSEYCAEICHDLAREQEVDLFEAYLSGLIQHVGLIVVFRLIDQIAQSQELPWSEDFVRSIQMYGRKLSVGIARQWDFPANVIEVLNELVLLAEVRPVQNLTQLLARSNYLSQLHILLQEQRLELNDDYLRALTTVELQSLKKINRVKE
jgi:HD-like signal output (HDOD) protein